MEGDTIRWNDKWHSSTALYTLDDDRCEGAFRDNNLCDGRLSLSKSDYNRYSSYGIKAQRDT